MSEGATIDLFTGKGIGHFPHTGVIDMAVEHEGGTGPCALDDTHHVIKGIDPNLIITQRLHLAPNHLANGCFFHTQAGCLDQFYRKGLETFLV